MTHVRKIPVSATPGYSSRTVWGLAVLLFGVGDVVTTVVGLQVAGVVERGPVLARLSGTALLVALPTLKVGAFGLGYLSWRQIPAPYHMGVPLGLALLGFLVTVWNSLVVGTALLL